MTTYVNPAERVVKVNETPDGKTRTFHAIRDEELGYWRGIGTLTEYDAWTRDKEHRAEFDTRATAVQALSKIAKEREKIAATKGQ